jgi:hypothetical protein
MLSHDDNDPEQSAPHPLASRLLAAGVAETDISRLLGHSTLSTDGPICALVRAVEESGRRGFVASLSQGTRKGEGSSGKNKAPATLGSLFGDGGFDDRTWQKGCRNARASCTATRIWGRRGPNPKAQRTLRRAAGLAGIGGRAFVRKPRPRGRALGRKFSKR